MTSPNQVIERGITWRLTESLVSHTSFFQKKISDDEKEIINNIKESRGTHGYNIISRTNIVLNENPKLLPKWGDSQTIARLTCTCNHVRLLIRRKVGLLLVYESGFHSHLHSDKNKSQNERGLSVELKRYLDPYINIPRGSSHAIARLCIMEPNSRNRIMGAYTLQDLAGKTGLKRKIIKYLSYRKKVNSKQKDKLLVGIGNSQTDLISFLDSNRISVEEILEFIAKGNEPKGKLWIVSEDFSKGCNGDFTHITFLHSESIQILRNAFATMKYRRHALQAELDYTHLDDKEESTPCLLGVLGTSDMHRKFHPILYDLNVTENAVGSARLLVFLDLIALQVQEKHISILKDAATALKTSAAGMLHLEERDCLTHKVRSKDWSLGKRPSGTRGSLETYLLNKGCKKIEVKRLQSIMLALDTLPTVREYKIAIKLLYKSIESDNWTFSHSHDVKHHIKSEYFPMSPRIGPIHEPVETHSTNGLERTWHPSKESLKVFRGDFKKSTIEACINFVKFRSTIQNTSPEYIMKPKQTLEDWRNVRECTNGIPGRFRHMILFVDGKQKPVQSLRKSLPDSFEVYVPYNHLIERIYSVTNDINLSNLNKDEARLLDKARHGLITKNEVLRRAADAIAEEFSTFIASPLETDTVYTFLQRHGQRNSEKLNSKVISQYSNLSPSSLKKRRKREKDMMLEFDKWSQEVCEVKSEEGKESSKANKSEYLPLQKRELGLFCRVSITTGQSDPGLDMSDDGYRLRCTCEDYQKGGTCFEVKLFGWIFLDRHPTVDVLPHVTSGLTKERAVILENLEAAHILSEIHDEKSSTAQQI